MICGGPHWCRAQGRRVESELEQRYWRSGSRAGTAAVMDFQRLPEEFGIGIQRQAVCQDFKAEAFRQRKEAGCNALTVSSAYDNVGQVPATRGIWTGRNQLKDFGSGKIRRVQPKLKSTAKMA